MSIEPLSRRSLLGRSATGLGLVLAGDITGLFSSTPASAAVSGTGYGPLVPDPQGLLSLPEGFSYELVSQAGVTELEGGGFSPSDPDGTAAFKGRGGGTVLVMNHEISGSEPHKVPLRDGFVYDPACGGGTTTLEVDRDGRRVRQYVSLAGTLNNCAGGVTPWNTWITCEEAERQGAIPHGYCFEVNPYYPERNRNPKPIKAFGRYAHESVVVEPGGGNRVYLTEDASGPNGLLYRWTPPAGLKKLGPGVFRQLGDRAGKLEALKAFTTDGTHVPDLSVATEPGTTYTATWVTVPDRDAATVSTRKQFADGQITRSRKLEGMWWGDGGAYFTASFARFDDGSAAQHDGQVWFHDPAKGTIELKLHFAYTPEDQDSDPDGPDNITVSPYGGLIIAEDGEGKSHLVGSTTGGDVYFLARNEVEGDSEFCGPTFSHDRKTLFANVQTPGTVFAIRGPWRHQ